ncbi:hypothetical protein [Methylobacterium symbioticum]|nr:hypothetical protein [Methylobacterium symbioticum]
MSTVVTYIARTRVRTVQAVGPAAVPPIGSARRPDLGSLQALALAIASAILTTGAMALAH